MGLKKNLKKAGLTPEEIIAITAYKLIRDDPDRWDQSVWRTDSDARPWAMKPTQCGATLCYFGHIADMNGGLWLSPAGSENSHFLFATPEDRPEDLDSTEMVVRGEEVEVKFIHVEKRAARLLGLDPDIGEDRDHMNALSSEYNELEDIRQNIEEAFGFDPEDFV